jgi:hypothetical protein
VKHSANELPISDSGLGSLLRCSAHGPELHQVQCPISMFMDGGWREMFRVFSVHGGAAIRPITKAFAIGLLPCNSDDTSVHTSRIYNGE